MKQIILSLVLIISVSVFSQTQAGKNTVSAGDCDRLLKIEDLPDGKLTTAARDNIIISKDNGKTGLSVLLLKGSGAIILNFSTLGKGIWCIRKDAKGLVYFHDGTQMEIKHMGSLDCKGNFSCFLGEATGYGNELEQLKSKKIRKLSIEYTETENGAIKIVTTETEFPDTEAEKIMNILQCMTAL